MVVDAQQPPRRPSPSKQQSPGESKMTTVSRADALAIIASTIVTDDIETTGELFSSVILNQVQTASNYTVQQLEQDENE
jgi:hypothetical protein